ncbi:MAG: MobA/MobL family protein [Sphingobium sp.]
MAIFHLQASIISRGAGRSVIAAAAWQNSCRLYDERLGRFCNFANKRAVVWSELMLPPGAPACWEDREGFWNALEAAEIRKDAQLARQYDVALPDELDLPEAIAVLRRFASEIFCVAGFAADLTLIEMGDTPRGKRHHGYLLIPTRPIVGDVFGQKPREWNSRAKLLEIRAAWAAILNESFAALGQDVRVDHRSNEERGIEAAPVKHIGMVGKRIAERAPRDGNGRI